jgi:predicted TPR repeat methyltransferase
VGVDISQKMLDIAASKNLYQELIRGDAVEALYDLDESFDLIAAIEVPIYLGDLWGLTAAVAERLEPGGLYIYSVETMETGTFKLLPTQRFAHNIRHVESMAAAIGLTPLTGHRTNIRLEGNVPVAGYIGVLVKSEAAA